MPLTRKLDRRILIAVAAVALLTFGSPHAAASDFPTKQMVIVVPFAAGGAADIIGRTIADKLGKIYGKQIVVENRPGAGSNVGIYAVAKSEPDGHTIVLASIALAVNPSLYKSMPFNPAKDLAPLTLALETPNIVIVPASSNIKSLQDLIAYAKSKQGGANYASAGVGSSLHLAAEMFRQQAKIELTHVPYRGSSPALTDLITGRIDVMFDNASTAIPQIQGGTVRSIAVTTRQRIAALPNVPTIAEAGLPEFEMGNWWAFFVSGKTPAPLVERISADIRKVLADPEVQKRFADVSGRIIASTSEELAKHLAAENLKWRRILETAGMVASQ